jgi:hypothetical protein
VREACKVINSEATFKGYNSSSPCSPGMHNWDIQELGSLLGSVAVEKIGVKLTSGGMMYPRKSVAMIIGIGQNMFQKSPNETCAYCNLKDSCRHRR